MKIKAVRIEGFRSFQDEIIALSRYTCLVGPNGAGKSTVLAALNVFFRDQSSATDTSKLADEDYFSKNTANPVRITVTFDDLGVTAQSALADYVRLGELVVTAEATFDPLSGFGQVRHFGQRMGMAEFRSFFEAEKGGARVADLSEIFVGIREKFTDLNNVRTKELMASALRSYEADHPGLCALIPSEDQFYGLNSTGKLAAFVQWVYVPAVKDASEEGLEGRNTALAKLIASAVRTRTNFDADLATLKSETLAKYRGLLDRNQEGLSELGEALQRRLEAWAHPDVQLGIAWLSDENKAVVLQPPVAGIKTGDGDFLGSLARMGHGLQRSYLLALLQELAGSEAIDAPTLILGCEEPELYQHPRQARHLADVFAELSNSNNQILVTSHSPLFVSGEGFENTRLVRRTGAGSSVRSLTSVELCARIRASMDEDPARSTQGLIAKIHQALQPNIAEMFFARVPVLVEGLEDVSYITTQLHLSNLWTQFRRLGCHLVAVNGKDKLIQPLAIATQLGIPVFVVFDADEHTQRPDHRIKHERDNKTLISLLGASVDPFPSEHVWGKDHAIWDTELTLVVKGDFGGDYDRFANAARQHYAQEGGLEKNDLFIADWVSAAYQEGFRSPSLKKLAESILTFAGEGAAS
jgi:putative ATP-dependent endonuclease of OLD family